MLKIRLRSLFNRFPVLDGWRIWLLATICTKGPLYFDKGYRVTKFIAPDAKPYIKEGGGGKPAIIAVFHGRMVGLLDLHPREKITILISHSRDGEIIARGCAGMGFSIARGSPAKGVFQGSREMLEAANSGQSLAFMVDGPRGPIYEVKPAIIRLAEVTGLPIIPFFSQSRTNVSKRIFKSWDEFMAPQWSTPIAYFFGEPIFVPAACSEADREKLLRQLQTSMLDLKEQGQKFFQTFPNWP